MVAALEFPGDQPQHRLIIVNVGYGQPRGKSQQVYERPVLLRVCGFRLHGMFLYVCLR